MTLTMTGKTLVAISLALANGFAAAHEGHDHGKKAKKVKKSKAKRAAVGVAAWRARPRDTSAPACTGVPARDQGRNCNGGLNHSLSFLSHYCDRPAFGRRVAPVHSV